MSVPDSKAMSTARWLLEQRYKEEPIFRQIVDNCHRAMRKLPLTVDDLEQVLSLALEHYREEDAARPDPWA